MRVCVYCRVGNTGQLDGMAMDAQRGRFKRFAEDKAWQIVKEVCEYGAGTAMTRPGLQEVAELVRAGQVDFVLIQNLSRLSRRKQEADDFLNLLHQHNVTLFSINEGLALPPRQELNIALLASL